MLLAAWNIFDRSSGIHVNASLSKIYSLILVNKSVVCSCSGFVSFSYCTWFVFGWMVIAILSGSVKPGYVKIRAKRVRLYALVNILHVEMIEHHSNISMFG